MELIYQDEQYRFYLVFTGADNDTPARMQVVREDADGNSINLMDYVFPVQLMPEVHVKDKGTVAVRAAGEKSSEKEREENGGKAESADESVDETVLTFSLHLEVHHVSGMVQGEFTEDETYEVQNPLGDAEEMACVVTDIVRKTRFAAAPRHLEHVPKQTYPPVDGKQGPYGHPAIRTLPPIPKRKHIQNP